MKRNQKQLQTTAIPPRQAFTLVELLVVCAIIVILVGLTLFAMSMVASSAKITKTRATIQKIDMAMQSIFGMYEREFNIIKNNVWNHPDYSGLSEEIRQMITAHFIRDLMRMEMPQSWAEVFDSASSDVPLGPLETRIPPNSPTIFVKVEESPLLEYYWKAYQTTEAYRTATEKEPNRAALLFLIIQNLNPEALESFHGSEVADTDGDGLLEFVDAWGNPIQFLRWAPAFSGSDIQQDVVKMAGGVPSENQTDKENWWRNREMQLLKAMKDASMNHSDPMDERTDVDVIGWFLYPLIYSAGPDSKYEIAVESIEDGSLVSPKVGSEGILDPFMFPFGMPYGTGHFDNIHNHQWYRSF